MSLVRRTSYSFVCLKVQARRQDLAAGGAKKHKDGPKPEGGAHF